MTLSRASNEDAAEDAEEAEEEAPGAEPDAAEDARGGENRVGMDVLSQPADKKIRKAAKISGSPARFSLLMANASVPD